VAVGTTLPRIGLQVWGQFTDWPALAATARRVEEIGFASLYSNDHLFPAAGVVYQAEDAPPGPFLEGWITLAGFAMVTSRVELGVLVSSAGYRNVGLLVKQATAVDHLSGGRAVLGLGAGWHQRDHRAFGFGLPPIRERLDRLEEQAAAARALLAGGTVSADGRHVQLDRAVNLPAPVRERLPLLIGGSGEKRTLRIVARYADVWNGEGDAETWGRRNRILDEHCAAVGRAPASIRRTVGLPPASIRPTRAAAVEALVDRFRANGLAADEARDAAEASPLVGTADAVAEALRAYAAAGAAEALIDWLAPFDDETLVALAGLMGRNASATGDSARAR
jgi:alkanesulfonate monooxygenase SsuD/methylene tetrahydromethanopterin reductase-like flavin-dependent oxidoreductase (luciferase family)